MFEQDYIMRLIKEMVRALLKLIFGIDTESPTTELLEDAQKQNTLNTLTDMIDAGNIDDAENKIYALMENGSKEYLKMAILFYSYLNEKDDDFLIEHDFTREEIKTGLENVLSDCGYHGIAEAFLE